MLKNFISSPKYESSPIDFKFVFLFKNQNDEYSWQLRFTSGKQERKQNRPFRQSQWEMLEKNSDKISTLASSKNCFAYGEKSIQSNGLEKIRHQDHRDDS